MFIKDKKYLVISFFMTIQIITIQNDAIIKNSNTIKIPQLNHR